MEQKARKERRVVIVDDSRTMRTLIETAFSERRDFVVVGIAADAQTAVEMVGRLKPDVITIDLCMPYIDGTAMLRLLEGEVNLCKVIVSDLTARNLKMRNMLEELGANACLSKRDLVENPILFFGDIEAACERLALARKARSDRIAVHARPRPTPTAGSREAPGPDASFNVGFPMPIDENARLIALERKQLANAVAERQFDLVTQYVAEATVFPVCLITFIDRTTQWVKSSYGLNLESSPRSEAFCAYTIARDDTMIVTNATVDPRFAKNPFVTGEIHLRTYIGHPIVAADGTHLGALCVIDTKPRIVQKSAVSTIAAMARIVAEMIEHRPALAA